METTLILAAVVLAVVFAVRWVVVSRKNASLVARVERLAKWEKVADADEAASTILREAKLEAERASKEAAEIRRAASEAGDAILQKARGDAERSAQEAEEARRVAAEASDAIRRAAEEEADTLRRGARDSALKVAADAEARVASAQARARSVIEEANRKAEEIAGEAFRAAQNAKELEQTVRALENTIEGYGDRYIIPTHTLLDDLAEGFAHTDAGQNLKLTRERVREAVRTGRAATCDYVEDNRRQTAIRFVTDAFNGKVDSILTKVRHDNVGTLQRELTDAAALVNLNGKAFRNARVAEDFVKLRAEEIRWAVILHELKEQEREEQRRIKEQLREEERARKEYERVMRDAARQEETLRKAMEKARQELAQATEEQKAKYEGQLQELQQRLTEAEQRNQRAMSMAQQTRRGHVYVISNIGSFGEQVFKIGLTRRLEPLDRIRELGDSSVPFEFDVHALVFSEDAPALEAQLHRHFILNQVNKVNYRKEFFRVTLAEIRKEMEGLGLTLSWTMVAEAQQYRESLAIEKAIADNPNARDAWLKRQLLLEPVDVPEESEDAAA